MAAHANEAAGSGGPAGADGAMLRAILEGLQSGNLHELIEPLTRGASTPAALQAIVEQANLRPEQTTIFNLLMALQGGEDVIDAPAVEVVDPEPAADPPESRRWRSVQRELADLREVNDTVAAALGACNVCWGGDAACGACRGDGGPGSLAPDPVLFERLILPAVRRVRRPERSSEREWQRHRR